jgi:hypothetical protein
LPKKDIFSDTNGAGSGNLTMSPPSGKLTVSHGKSPCLMGKPTKNKGYFQ